MENIYFYDTEFIERGAARPVQLISIAIVSLDGRELYAVSNEFNPADCNDWVKQNVLPLLPSSDDVQRISVQQIAAQVRHFVGSAQPTFWADCACYDHVVLAQSFGSMAEYPVNWPYYTKDLQILVELLGSAVIRAQHPGVHSALREARWLRSAWLDFRTAVYGSDGLTALRPLFSESST